MPTFKTTTLGCKVNQYESDAISESLRKSGFTHADKGTHADVCIINTCTVTGKASMQSRQAIRKIIRMHPKARVIVTGCYSQVEREEIKKIEGVHDVVPHDDKQRIPDIIVSQNPVFSIREDKTTNNSLDNNACKATIFREMPSTSPGKRTRPFLKIQDGCNSYCSYCIVPYTRGRSRSMLPESVLTKALHLKQSGYKEIVLTGIHLGAYGRDLTPQTNLLEILKTLVNQQAIGRLRLSSIEPGEISDEMIKIVSRTDMICNHLHIPLQSGDDNILKRMNRPYTTSLFEDSIKKIRHMIPDAAIGTDILTGFPGETDQEFDNTYALIEKLPITYLHVFPFSPRKGTKACDFEHQVPPDISKERSQRLRSLGKNKKLQFYSSMIGKDVEVLIENQRDRKTGLLKGLSSNYIKVLVSGTDTIKNTIQKIKIEKLSDEQSVYGVPLS